MVRLLRSIVYLISIIKLIKLISIIKLIKLMSIIKLIRTLLSRVNKLNHVISQLFIAMSISYVECSITTVCKT